MVGTAPPTTTEVQTIAMTAFILPLDDPFAADPERVGPKAANLAALTHAGLPPPGACALTADAYRHQLLHLGIEDLLRQYNQADVPVSRRISIQIRLALYERAIAPEILDPLLAAGRRQREIAPLGVVRSSALIEDRAGANFAGQFESFLGLSDETEFLTAVRACCGGPWDSHGSRATILSGGSVVFPCTRIHEQSRTFARRPRDGHP